MNIHLQLFWGSLGTRVLTHPQLSISVLVVHPIQKRHAGLGSEALNRRGEVLPGLELDLCHTLAVVVGLRRGSPSEVRVCCNPQLRAVDWP